MRHLRLPVPVSAFLVAFALVATRPTVTLAQDPGGVTGTVTRADDGSALGGVSVVIAGTNISTTTNPRGQYTILRVPAGPQTVVFRWLGFASVEVEVTVPTGGMATADAQMSQAPISLAEIVVTGASRAPERVVEAPSAIVQLDPRVTRATSITGQAPLMLRDVPGIHLAQSGVYEFNVNTRGFNSSLNRRVLVLQDGRDLAVAFLGSQEWAALSLPTEDFRTVEFVSGPGSALYGANAYNGVLDIITPTAREAQGTRITLGGGSLSTYRADLRHGAVFGDGRHGVRVNVGFASSDTWSRSRTNFDQSALRTEYSPVTDSTVPNNIEFRALAGQTINSTTGAPEGDRDPIQRYYGSLRYDMYANNGGVFTAEGGYGYSENEVFVTGIGRVQVTGASRPWARVAMAHPRYNVMAYWSGRRTIDPQWSLGANIPLEEKSDIYHVEAQGNNQFADNRLQVVYGGSWRYIHMDTKQTLILPQYDNRNDSYIAAYAQLSWDLSDQVKLVAAGRFDDGSLISAQFSPKGSLVFSPNDHHSLRFTVNRAFQTPNYSEFFLRVPAGAPANFSALEAGLRASPLGPALAGVPQGQLFDPSSSAVAVYARGNDSLDVETQTGLEFGYRGDVHRRFSVTLDAYYNFLYNFVTDLLPGVNPQFAPWTAPDAVPEQFRSVLESTVRQQLLGAGQSLAAAGLTRLENGNSAIVVSYTNAGEAKMWGANLGASWQMSDEFQVDGYLSWFDYEVDTATVRTGDKVLANTPEWRTRLAVGYTGRQGFDARVGMQSSSGFPWTAGVYTGWVEPAVTFDVDAGYRINNNWRVFASAINLFDKQWFSIYGGSVNGVRVLGGVTATF